MVNLVYNQPNPNFQLPPTPLSEEDPELIELARLPSQLPPTDAFRVTSNRKEGNLSALYDKMQAALVKLESRWFKKYGGDWYDNLSEADKKASDAAYQKKVDELTSKWNARIAKAKEKAAKKPLKWANYIAEVAGLGLCLPPGSVCPGPPQPRFGVRFSPELFAKVMNEINIGDWIVVFWAQLAVVGIGPGQTAIQKFEGSYLGILTSKSSDGIKINGYGPLRYLPTNLEVAKKEIFIPFTHRDVIQIAQYPKGLKGLTRNIETRFIPAEIMEALRYLAVTANAVNPPLGDDDILPLPEIKWEQPCRK